jgi:hypothetical protein
MLAPKREARLMSSNPTAIRASGAWLTIGSVLLAAVLALHGPLNPDLSVQMARIADSASRWRFVHWMAAVSLSCFAVSALLILTADSRLTASTPTTSAWAVLFVGAIWTLTTAVTEVTVIADLAVQRDLAQFEAWWSFAEGNGNGFAAFALGVAVIASCELRATDLLVPAWSSVVGTIAGLASCAGWVLGVWFNVGPANLVWVVASGVMCLWLALLGSSMVRRAHL